MLEDTEEIDPLQAIITNALEQIQDLMKKDLAQKEDGVSSVNLFLQRVISETIDLIAPSFPEDIPYLYVELQAFARLKSFETLKKMQLDKGLDHLFNG